MPVRSYLQLNSKSLCFEPVFQCSHKFDPLIYINSGVTEPVMGGLAVFYVIVFRTDFSLEPAFLDVVYGELE